MNSKIKKIYDELKEKGVNIKIVKHVDRSGINA